MTIINPIFSILKIQPAVPKFQLFFFNKTLNGKWPRNKKPRTNMERVFNYNIVCGVNIFPFFLKFIVHSYAI